MDMKRSEVQLSQINTLHIEIGGALVGRLKTVSECKHCERKQTPIAPNCHCRSDESLIKQIKSTIREKSGSVSFSVIQLREGEEGKRKEKAFRDIVLGVKRVLTHPEQSAEVERVVYIIDNSIVREGYTCRGEELFPVPSSEEEEGREKKRRKKEREVAVEQYKDLTVIVVFSGRVLSLSKWLRRRGEVFHTLPLPLDKEGLSRKYLLDAPKTFSLLSEILSLCLLLDTPAISPLSLSVQVETSEYNPSLYKNSHVLLNHHIGREETEKSFLALLIDVLSPVHTDMERASISSLVHREQYVFKDAVLLRVKNAMTSPGWRDVYAEIISTQSQPQPQHSK